MERETAMEGGRDQVAKCNLDRVRGKNMEGLQPGKQPKINQWDPREKDRVISAKGISNQEKGQAHITTLPQNIRLTGREKRQ